MTNKLPGVAVYPHVTNANATTSPADDTAVTNALRALMALDAVQLATLAAKLATEDGALLDRLADMLLGNIGVDLPPVMPSERFLRNVLANVDREDDPRYSVIADLPDRHDDDMAAAQ